MLLAERQHNAVVGGGGLQLEIERAAEALAQRQTPGAIDARAEGSVQHELHAAAFIEETLGHYMRGSGKLAERAGARLHISDGLFGAEAIEAGIAQQPVELGRGQDIRT